MAVAVVEQSLHYLFMMRDGSHCIVWLYLLSTVEQVLPASLVLPCFLFVCDGGCRR